MLAKHALSQLSYDPVSRQWSVAGGQKTPRPFWQLATDNWQLLVGPGGLEPPTSRLSSARSNQLSYEPSGQLSAASGQIRAGPTLAADNWPLVTGKGEEGGG